MQFIFLLLSIIAGQTNPSDKIAGEKILEFSINGAGKIISMGDTLAADKIVHYVQERLFKSWIGGKMYSRIRVINSASDEITKDLLIKEIQEGQRQALIAVCLESFRRRYENLDPKKQEKLRLNYPALFQTEYHPLLN